MAKTLPLEAVLNELETDPEFRAERDRNAVADAVAVWLVGYRATHGLSQRQLAGIVGMKQAAIARLEVGDVEPKLSTLQRLARALHTELLIELGTNAVAVTSSAAAPA